MFVALFLTFLLLLFFFGGGGGGGGWGADLSFQPATEPVIIFRQCCQPIKGPSFLTSSFVGF